MEFCRKTFDRILVGKQLIGYGQKCMTGFGRKTAMGFGQTTVKEFGWNKKANGFLVEPVNGSAGKMGKESIGKNQNDFEGKL